MRCVSEVVAMLLLIACSVGAQINPDVTAAIQTWKVGDRVQLLLKTPKDHVVMGTFVSKGTEDVTIRERKGKSITVHLTDIAAARLYSASPHAHILASGGRATPVFFGVLGVLAFVLLAKALS